MKGKKRRSDRMNSLIEATALDDKKIAIEFLDRKNRIRGTAVLLFIKEGFAQSLGKGKYLISDYLEEYLKNKGIEFRKIELPPKFRT